METHAQHIHKLVAEADRQTNGGKKVKLLEENSGKFSAIRLYLFASLLIAGYISIAGVILDRDLLGLTGLVAIFVAVPVAGKVGQKGKE